MFELTISEILTKTNGKLVQGLGTQKINSISTDSRTIGKGAIFIPLSGANFDGHNFVYNAFQKGAQAVLGNKEKIPEIISQLNKLGIKHANPLPPVILVQDTLIAYQEIARFVRSKINPTVIGITGSSGKTSTKEYLYTLLSQFHPTLKSEANFNNEIGVPKTLLALEPDHKFAIIEMAMRAKGEIDALAKIADPDIGIITNIGSAHLGKLGSKEAIAEAKWELAEYLKNKNAPLILNGDDAFLVEKARDYPADKVYFTSIDKDNQDAHIVMLDSCKKDGRQYLKYLHRPSSKTGTVIISNFGDHHISNALQAVLAGINLNLPLKDVIDLTSSAIAGRNEIINLNNIIIINDAYNANPESMRAAIGTFCQSYPGRKILLLGEMKELGEESDSLHFQLGEFCAGLPINILCVVGKAALKIIEGAISSKFNIMNVYSFPDNESAAEELHSIVNEGDFMFFKASRDVKLEEVIEKLKIKFLGDFKVEN